MKLYESIILLTAGLAMLIVPVLIGASYIHILIGGVFGAFLFALGIVYLLSYIKEGEYEELK